MIERVAIITDDQFFPGSRNTHREQAALFLIITFGVGEDGSVDSGDEHFFELTPFRSVQGQQVDVILPVSKFDRVLGRKSQKIQKQAQIIARFFQQFPAYNPKILNILKVETEEFCLSEITYLSGMC